jgi:hypothetical protein
VPGIIGDNEEVKAKSLSTCDLLNCFIFSKFKKPPLKQPQLFANLQSFWYQYRYIFLYFLRKLAHSLLFEDHKNIWNLSKVLHSTIVLCEMGQSESLPLSLTTSGTQPQDRMPVTTFKIFEDLIQNFEKD